MLARRIIPVILHRGFQAVKGRQFDSQRTVGHVRQCMKVQQGRDVDEVVLLDIGATLAGAEPNFAMMRDLLGDCFFPVTCGGGIRTIEHFRQALANGADKVAINSSALERPQLVREAAEKFGRQAVVVSIDVRQGLVWGRCGTKETGLNPVAWAETVEALGAGEIIINSIERDGMMTGYDLELIRAVSAAVSIPVVAAGGAGSYEDFALALEAGAHAVSAGALFAFCDATPAGAAEFLHSKGYPVRRKLAA